MWPSLPGGEEKMPSMHVIDWGGRGVSNREKIDCLSPLGEAGATS